jgi:hypothetical protein
MVENKDLKIFAFIWSGIFIILAIYNNINIFFYIAVIFLIIGFFKPFILTGFYNIWIKVGEFIGGIVSKIIMFILYFGLFTPISIFLKILGKDLLNKKVNKSEKSYWIKRETQPQSMKNQF